MTDVAIRVENLSKLYRIGAAQQARYRTLREALVEAAQAPVRRAARLLRGEAYGAAGLDETLWALKDVSFEIGRGEAVGIIGRNGAGKTTLLKILSRITEPTEGRAEIRGRVGSLLEVGTGFHPELTGRENIYLNGAILGMRRHEIEHKFDEMVAFAEVERFLDTPVKHYSSGMYVRLAFSVAAHLEPEILLVDEVLAVGDAAFQKKCLGKMGEVAGEGRTVVFVSHNMRAITDLCRSAFWIDGGRIRGNGSSQAIVHEYLGAGMSVTGQWRRPPSGATATDLELLEAEVRQSDRSPTGVIEAGKPFCVAIRYHVRDRLRDCSILLRMVDMQGTPIFTSWDTDADASLLDPRQPGWYQSVCHIPAHLLKPGRYNVTIGAHIYRVRVLDYQESILSFDISEVGYALNRERIGIVQPILEWTVGPT